MNTLQHLIYSSNIAPSRRLAITITFGIFIFTNTRFLFSTEYFLNSVVTMLLYFHSIYIITFKLEQVSVCIQRFCCVQPLLRGNHLQEQTSFATCPDLFIRIVDLERILLRGMLKISMSLILLHQV